MKDSKKKLIDKDSLELFEFEFSMLCKQLRGSNLSDDMSKHLERVEKLFHERVLERDRENLNDIKRAVYVLMKHSKGLENKCYYNIYQALKNNEYTVDEAKQAIEDVQVNFYGDEN